MNMRLEDQVAIVTGGTRGIGRAISLVLAQEGAEVIANFSKDISAAEDLMTEAKSRGLKIRLFKADVTQFDQVKEMVEETFAQYGRIDILVNNVGLIRDNFLMLMSDEDWDSLMKTNLTSLFHCCKTVIRKMIPERRGEDHQYLLYQWNLGHCWPDQLCGDQRRDDQLHQIPRS